MFNRVILRWVLPAEWSRPVDLESPSFARLVYPTPPPPFEVVAECCRLLVVVPVVVVGDPIWFDDGGLAGNTGFVEALDAVLLDVWIVTTWAVWLGWLGVVGRTPYDAELLLTTFDLGETAISVWPLKDLCTSSGGDWALSLTIVTAPDVFLTSLLVADWLAEFDWDWDCCADCWLYI